MLVFQMDFQPFNAASDKGPLVGWTQQGNVALRYPHTDCAVKKEIGMLPSASGDWWTEDCHRLQYQHVLISLWNIKSRPLTET